jgi:hypothetical protein
MDREPFVEVCVFVGELAEELSEATLISVS